MNDKERLSPEEATKHARIGGCIILFLLPIICYCICWPLLTWTPRGRVITAHAILYFTYNGLSIPVRYLEGFPGTARAGCALDRQRPANYQTAQASLKTEYDSLVRLYKQQWQQLRKDGGDPSQYEDPERVPSDFNAAKLYFCR
jgi:hypothetical protein